MRIKKEKQGTRESREVINGFSGLYQTHKISAGLKLKERNPPTKESKREMTSRTRGEDNSQIVVNISHIWAKRESLSI